MTDASRLAECKGSGAHCDTHKQAFRWCSEAKGAIARRFEADKKALETQVAEAQDLSGKLAKMVTAHGAMTALFEREMERADKAEASLTKVREAEGKSALKALEWEQRAERLSALVMKQEGVGVALIKERDAARAEADALRAALERVVDDCPSGPAFCIFPVHQIARAALAGTAKAEEARREGTPAVRPAPAAARPAEGRCEHDTQYVDCQMGCEKKPAPAPSEACPGMAPSWMPQAHFHCDPCPHSGVSGSAILASNCHLVNAHCPACPSRGR